MGRPRKNPTAAEELKDGVVMVTDEATATEEFPKKKQAITGPINGGGWNTSAENPEQDIKLNFIHVELMYTSRAMATSPGDPNLYANYIASKAPDALTREEEIAALGTDEVEKRACNKYNRGTFRYDESRDTFYDHKPDPNSNKAELYERYLPAIPEDSEFVSQIPYLYDYQIRGFFKDSCGLLSRAGKKEASNNSSDIKAYKKTVDGCVFVLPRRVAINIPENYLDDDGVTVLPSYEPDGSLKVIQRPLRASTAQGDRVTIACSESVPAGSSMKFTIAYTDPSLRDVIIEWLNYGVIHGLSGWRNAGWGTFKWRELKEDYTPYTE